MKKLLLPLILLGTLSFISCDDDDPVTPDAAYMGSFVDAVHPTSGTAAVNEAETVLTLANFKTDSGPDLNIYLASDLADVTGDFVDLGDIKGVDGTYEYDLPGSTDFTHYQYVVVWCVAFDVNFGYAELN